MSENKEKLEKLEAEFKQVEVEATKVMEEYQKAQVLACALHGSL